MLLLNLLLVVQIIVCVAMVAVILLQRSEGGALGMGGGGTGGFMTARGAGNLLTKTTWVLATIFIVVSLSLTILGNVQRNAGSLLDEVTPGRVDPSALAPAAPAPNADATAQPGADATAPATTSLDSLAAPLPGATPAPAQPAPATK